jgi:hypothetical protein
MYSGEGKDRDPLRINSWFRAVGNYIKSFNITDSDPDALQYYGAYCKDSAADQFEIFCSDTENDTKTVPGLKKCFETYFLPSTSIDDLWHKWESIKQTQDGKVTPITETVIKLKNLRASLPPGTISDFAMKQRFLDCMDIRLRRVVQPHILPAQKLDEILTLAEKHDASNHATGVYKHNQGKQPSSNATSVPAPKKKQQPQAQSSRFGQPQQQKPHGKLSQAEKERRKREGLCLYCGKPGHYANTCWEKKGGQNQHRNQSHNHNKGPKPYTPKRSFHTEADLDNSIQSNVTSNSVATQAPQQMTLEAYIMVNGHPAKALFDTGTIGDNFISGKFISTHRLATETLENLIALKKAVKGSRSTINYQAMPVVQIGPAPGEITKALVSSLENYDIFLGMPYLNKHKAIIDCGNATIRFPEKGYNLQCKKGNTARFSAATSAASTPSAPTLPDFKSEFPAVFPDQKPSKLPPLRAINHRIQLTDTKTDSNPKIYTVPDKLMHKYREAIEQWKAAGIIYPSEAHNPVNMFPKLKPNGEVRLLADLVARNKITVKDH